MPETDLESRVQTREQKLEKIAAQLRAIGAVLEKTERVGRIHWEVQRFVADASN